MSIEVTEEEINDAVGKCITIINDVGTKFSGMSYEQGIHDTLEWVLGNGDNPTDEL